MKQNKSMLLFLVSLFLLASLACNLTGGDLPEVTLPADLSEQASTAATRAAETAATAAAAAATTAAQSNDALATAEAAATAANIQEPAMEMDALKDKFASIQPDENGNMSVTISDDELNQAIQATQAANAQAGNPPLIQNAQVTFTGGNIVLTGNVSEPVVAELTVVFRPYVVNGVLQFQVESATVGSIAVPAPLLTTAESTLNSTLGEAMSSLPAQVVLQDIIMGEGTMTIVGSKV